MGFNLRSATGIGAVSGNLNTLIAGTTTGLGSQSMQGVSPGTLMAKVALTAATATITLTLKWQVSLDNATWLDVLPSPENPANVIYATGTVAIKTSVIPAPFGVSAWPYARIAVTNGVATGGATDLYAASYSYLRPEFS